MQKKLKTLQLLVLGDDLDDLYHLKGSCLHELGVQSQEKLSTARRRNSPVFCQRSG